MPAGIRHLVEAIEELKALIASPPRSADSDTAAFTQVAQDVSTSIQDLRTDLAQREERQAGSISDIRATQTAIQQGIGGLASRLEAGEALRVALEAHSRELQDTREALEGLNRFAESLTTAIARLGNALERADAAGHDFAALDAWRDDFIHRVDGFLARVEKEAGVPVTDASTPEATALARVDRITARMALLEEEVNKATVKLDEAFGAVTTSLTEHGETMRRAEGSNLLTRKQVEFLRTAFNRKEREYRRLRHLWVSLPVILVAIVAGMLLESQMFLLYRLFR